jgi:hypothetical protein
VIAAQFRGRARAHLLKTCTRQQRQMMQAKRCWARCHCAQTRTTFLLMLTICACDAGVCRMLTCTPSLSEGALSPMPLPATAMALLQLPPYGAAWCNQARRAQRWQLISGSLRDRGDITIQYNTILPTGLKPASALASEPCSAHEGCGRDCTQFFLR